MSTQVVTVLEQRRAALSGDHKELAADLAFEASLLRTVVQVAHAPRTSLPQLPRERLAARLAAGLPVLHEEPVFVDVRFALDLLERLVRTVAEGRDGRSATAADAISAAVLIGRLDAEQLFAEAFVRHADHLAQLAAGNGLDPTVLGHLAGLAVAPSRWSYANALAPILEHLAEPGRSVRGTWREGYCPVCGSWPLAADAGPLALGGGLRCGACGIGWRQSDRLCPFCGTSDPRRVVRLEPEPTTGPLVGVQLCEVCGRYLKLARAIDALPPVLLAFEDLGSRALDDAASARGFQRPSGAGFRLELALPEPGWSDALAAFDAD